MNEIQQIGMICLKSFEDGFSVTLPKNNGVLFHYKMLKILDKLGFELVERSYEIENSCGEREEDENLEFIEVMSRNSFIRNLIKKEKYQLENRLVTVNSYYNDFDDLVSGLSKKVTISLDSIPRFEVMKNVSV
jgi:hypothetical protein